MKVAVVSESYADRVPAFGAVRAGLLRGNLDETIDTAGPVVVLEATVAPRLCIELVVQDGSYRLLAEADLADQPPGTYRLEWEAAQASRLAGRRAADVALLVSQRKHCDKAAERYEASSWSGVVGGPLTVLVNTGGIRTSLIYKAASGERREIPCRPIANGQAIAYDSSCAIDEPEAIDRSEPLRLERRRHGSRLSPISIPLQ